jgi:hypothetical protein
MSYISAKQELLNLYELNKQLTEFNEQLKKEVAEW